MIRKLLILGLSLVASNTFAQSSAGLIAHWDMNGTTNDVSGHNHTGVSSNITSAAGMYGNPNTAYSFNGVNSVITSPYLPDMDISTFSICAIVNVKGFYSGTCQANTIITRGKFYTAGNYMLYFTDNPFDGNDCFATDSSIDVFCTQAGGWATPYVNWQYTPTIVKNNWYRVVGTWDGTNYRIYVNGTLMTTSSATGSFGNCTDGFSIGSQQMFDATYPYPFKGLIDDIRIYNRVLTDSETVHYGDTCGRITSQPSNKVVHPGGTTTYVVAASIKGATYQWQQNSGTGFTNLSNAGAFSGVTTPTLTVTGVSTSMNNYIYRCLLSNTWGCADTTTSAQLALGIDNILTPEMISIYPNPANNIVSIELPYAGNGNITLLNEVGQVIITSAITDKINDIDLTHLPTGIYLTRIQIDEQTIYKKIIKR